MTTWILWIEERDRELLGILLRWRSASITFLMRAVTLLGEPAVAAAIGLALVSGLLLPFDGAGGEAFMALVVSHLGVQLLKRSVTRERPSSPAGLTMLVQPPDRFSFPSGHAAAALSMALPVSATLSPGPGIALFGIAFLVGVSRPYLGVHYPSDVVVGWILGLGGALAAPHAMAFLG